MHRKRIPALALALTLVMLCELLAIGLTAFALPTDPTSIVGLTVNFKEQPLGIETDNLRFGWKMESPVIGQGQKAYQIVITKDEPNGAVVWDSGKVQSGVSASVPFTGNPSVFLPETRFYWTVNVTDVYDSEHISQPAYFETGADWGSAEWITIENFADGTPSLLFRTEQALNEEAGDIVSARLYITGLGVYDAYVNGKLVQGEVGSIMAPGWTDYSSYIHYQTYDVTDYLSKGDQAVVLGAIVGSGWYDTAAVAPAANGYRDMIGKTGAGAPLERCLFAKMVITYASGTQEIATNADSWKVSAQSPYGKNGLWEGEVYDAGKAKALGEWKEAGYDDSGWASAEAVVYKGQSATGRNPDNRGNVYASSDSLIYDFATLPLKAAYTYNESADIINVGNPYPKGEIDFSRAVSYEDGDEIFLKAGDTLIADFGQNAAARVAFQVEAPTGTNITINPAEIVSDGLDTGFAKGMPVIPGANRNAGSADGVRFRYTSSGDGIESYEARFHFCGYQYLSIKADKDVTFHSLSSIAISSVGKEIGFVETSSALVNQFVQNSKWSQASNYSSVPTDCPTREYYGWSGDAQLFVESGMYHFDSSLLIGKYIDSMDDYYKTYNGYGNIMPMHTASAFSMMEGSGWADAGIIVPYAYWQYTGDISLISAYWDNMRLYVDKQSATGLSYSLGDWNGIRGEAATTGFMTRAFNIYINDLMAQMASALGKQADTEKYAQNTETKRQAAIDRYVNAVGDVLCATVDGSSGLYGSEPNAANVFTDNSQTALSWALKLKLYNTEEQRQGLAANLAASIKNTGQSISERRGENTLATGFLGVNVLLPAVSEFHSDAAYDLMMSTNMYSPAYSVACGANSMWESWTMWRPESGYVVGSTSYNHYSYGAASEWIYEYMLGIQKDALNPGFKHFILQPQPNACLDYANGSYESYYGNIASNWTMNGDSLSTYNCTVPANTTATLYLPIDEAELDDFNQIPGLTYLGMEGHNGLDCAIFSLLSGGYDFEVTASGLVASHATGYIVPDQLMGAVLAEIRADEAAVPVNIQVSFTVSLMNVKGAGVVTLSFTVDGRYLDIASATALNGFSTAPGGNLTWEYVGGQVWKATVKVMCPGFVNIDGPLDVLKISGVARDLLGDATVTLTDITVTGDVDGYSSAMPSLIKTAEAVTSVVPKAPAYSKYDLNHDGKIDELDLAIVVYYYLANDLEADWDVVLFDIASAKDCDVARNGRVDLADMIEVIANYCNSYDL